MPRTPFAELRDKMSPAAKQRAKTRATQLVAELPLHELRAARERTQVQLALVLKVNQAAVSKLERRTDMYISTLRSYIQAMGGDLEIVAKFPDGAVQLTQFRDN